MIKNPKTMQEHMQGVESQQIQPNSIDLRVDRVFEIGQGLVIKADGSRELPAYEEVFPIDGMFRLVPAFLYQVEFMETIDMPQNTCGITLLRSTMFKSGASGESGLFDTGYRGNIGMTISTRHPVHIERGASIAQIMFYEATSSRQYNGYYQDHYEFMESEK